MFDAEGHFLSKIKSSSTDSADTSKLRIWLGNTPYVHPGQKPLPREPRFPYTRITEEAAAHLHELFLAFIQRMKSESPSTPMASLVYKVELVGARVSPVSHASRQRSAGPLDSGILVNETKNTLAIAHKGAVKIYPKAMFNFIIHLGSEKYFAIGPGLKSERRYSK
ncbi:uncharacterized protein NEMAJ01_1194 [Nematocida major]|uniref:uncharacterized protein n=1 Tax=Nematocida major TaxID=1912982 RepID=UPI0020082BA8|nr:uncharacterized protein NEMAJ01_1194 [Nematocida major]KAH9386298.1 hypothetical protein NEMAJ01_1194 [Nematocida major]